MAEDPGEFEGERGIQLSPSTIRGASGFPAISG